MNRIIKNLINKNIIKILTLYKDSIVYDNYIQGRIYDVMEHLIKLIKERRR